jgi:peptidoglycan/LPS O-acetylase OafA/YrhL
MARGTNTTNTQRPPGYTRGLFSGGFKRRDFRSASTQASGSEGASLLQSGDEAGTAPEDRAFRPDVQGLRAIAVMVVLLNHLGFPGMANGGVGVDIFFVISGFVITGILLREEARTRHTNIPAFYARRARRILPMAVLVIAVVVVVDRIVDGAALSHDVAIDGRYDALFQANGGYLRTWLQGHLHDGYTGPFPPPSLGGLAVYWSLAIEEKFYIVYPMLFLVIAAIPLRWVSVRVRLAVVLTGIIAASFLYAYGKPPPIGFYFSTPARAWELGAGCLLAVSTLWLRRIPTEVATFMTWIGLGGLIFVILYPPLLYPWPHGLPLLSVIATGLIIAGGTAVPTFGSELVLGRRPLQWLALWSFSLYLVHKPLVVWAVQLTGRPLSLVEEFVVGVIAIAVAAACYALIENPIRHSRLLVRSASASIAMGVLLIASCVILTIAVP